MSATVYANLATDNRKQAAAMPRPERPLDPGAGPIQAFASELRKLREEAGNPKYLQMARHSGKSRTALAEAAGGDHLPTWETVAAYVNACQGDPTVWRARWEQVRDEVQDASRPVIPLATIPAAPSDGSTAAADEAGASTQGDETPTLRSRLRRVLPFAVTALTSAVLAAAATAYVMARPTTPAPMNTSQPKSVLSGQQAVDQVGAGSVILTVQNKVALAADRLIEDPSGPVYLCEKTIPYCTRAGHKLSGTDMASGAKLIATCQTTGTEMFNYNLDSTESKTNPNRADSTLWYKTLWPDGRSGFISEVYIAREDRGGKGLPVCN